MLWRLSRKTRAPARRAIAVAAVLLPEPARPSMHGMYGSASAGLYEIAREAMKDLSPASDRYSPTFTWILLHRSTSPTTRFCR